MEATITNFRRGRHTVYTNQMIINIKGYDREKSKALIGQKVTWITPGKEKKEIKGEIKSTHGNKGALRVHFSQGMPGQAIGTKVEVAK